MSYYPYTKQLLYWCNRLIAQVNRMAVRMHVYSPPKGYCHYNITRVYPSCYQDVLHISKPVHRNFKCNSKYVARGRPGIKSLGLYYIYDCQMSNFRLNLKHVYINWADMEVMFCNWNQFQLTSPGDRVAYCGLASTGIRVCLRPMPWIHFFKLRQNKVRESIAFVTA